MSQSQEPNGTVPRTPPNYYSLPPQDLNLSAKFSNVDEPVTLSRYEKKLGDAGTRNFVNDVWRDAAWCATDLDAAEIELLLQTARPRESELRWINLWGGDLNKGAVEAIAAHYDLAPRLKALMCSAAVSSAVVNNTLLAGHADQHKDSGEVTDEKLDDVEDTAGAPPTQLAAEPVREGISLPKLEFGQVVNDIWHWCSVDWGKRYLCLGYNSIFTIPGVDFANGSNKPGGKRIWSWLVLCDDGTVVSIYENPFPNSVPNANILKVVRWNTLNVFRHLSKACKTDDQAGSLVTVQIRSPDRPHHSDNTTPTTESASLLLYYLFDDWITTYSLVARRQHPYGSELEQLRNDMTQVAKVKLVDDLHLIGRRLAVLKRVYQSYELIINRVLQRQRILRDDARHESRNAPDSRAPNAPHEHDDHGHTPSLLRSSTMAMLATSEDDSLGVRLSSSAIVRFERLFDRIRLYALSEIEECLTEKEALVFMVGLPFLSVRYLR